MKRRISSEVAALLFVGIAVVGSLGFAFPAHAQSVFQPIINLAGGACTCNGTSASGSTSSTPSAPDWGCVLQTIQTIMNDIVAFATIIITIYIAWAGIQYMMSATNPAGRQKARARVVNAVLGLCVVLAGWLFIDSLMKVIYNTVASGTGVASLGPWNSILSDTNAADDCIKVVVNIPALPELNAGSNPNGGGPQAAQPAQPAAPAPAAVAPSGACGAKTHLNCAAAVAYLVNNIHTTKSSHACLSAIQDAINAGGGSALACPGPTGHGWAGKCNGPLQSLGYTPLGGSDSSPQPADILVIQDSCKTKIGHITMFTGSAWISDFIQPNSETPPGNPYTSSGCGYDPQYYRP